MSSSGTQFVGKGEKPESPASGNVSCQRRGAILAIVLIKRNQWARLEISVFVDESGSFDPDRSSSRYYLVCMVFHDQEKDISRQIVTVTLAEFADCTNKTLEIVCRTDEGFDTTNLSRADVVNAGNDCAICYRGGGGFMVLGIYVNPADRTAYYTINTASPHNTAAQIRTLSSYSLVYDAGDYAKNSSLRVNDDFFTTGVSTNPKNYYYSPSTGFAHNQKAQIGLTRGNQYIASLRIYDRVLTAAERTANYKVDRARFLVPAPRDVSPYTVVHAGTNLIFR